MDSSLNLIPKISSRSSEIFALVLTVCVCSLGYLFISLESRVGHGPELFHYLGIHWLIGLSVFTYWIFLYRKKLFPNYRMVIFWALVFRLIGVSGSPVLEDDFYRYLLDGCVFLVSGSPYGITPESLFHHSTLSAQCQAALNWVNNPDLPTIYGPFLQYIFAFAHILSPADVTPLQLICALFDMGVILMLCKLTNARNVLLYAWNPLVLKELAFTAHPDIIGIFFLLAAFLLKQQQRNAIASVMIAVACASKIFAILALPWFIYRLKPKYILICFSTIILLYLPFLCS
jgi:hypothetical protein